MTGLLDFDRESSFLLHTESILSVVPPFPHIIQTTTGMVIIKFTIESDESGVVEFGDRSKRMVRHEHNFEIGLRERVSGGNAESGQKPLDQD